MRKFIKLFTITVLFLFSFHFPIIEGQATTISNAQQLYNLYTDYIVFNITEKDRIAENKYGKYFKINIPDKGLILIDCFDNLTLKLIRGKDNKETSTPDNSHSYIEAYLDEGGTYYIYTESGNTVKNVAFRYNYNKYFIEPETDTNDTKENAIDITEYTSYGIIYTNISGSINDSNDKDYYKIVIIHDSQLCFLHYFLKRIVYLRKILHLCRKI